MHRLSFEQEKKLIDYFRDHPSLWNTKNKDYNNRLLRTQKLQIIGDELGLTRKDVYEKYRNLRTTFFREHKRVTRGSCKANALGANGPHLQGYVSRWRHYNHMLFLTIKSSTSDDDEVNVARRQCSTRENSVSIIGRPASSLFTVSNDDSASLPNGHEIELISTASLPISHPHQQDQRYESQILPVNLNSDELIFIIQMFQTVQPYNLLIMQQAILSTGSNLISSTSSPVVSTVPVAGLSVIHAASSCSNPNQPINVANRRIKIEPIINVNPTNGLSSYQSGINSQQQQSAFLIKSSIGLMPSILTNCNPSVANASTNVSNNVVSNNLTVSNQSINSSLNDSGDSMINNSNTVSQQSNSCKNRVNVSTPKANQITVDTINGNSSSYQSQSQSNSSQTSAKKSSFFLMTTTPALQSSQISATKDRSSSDSVQQNRSSIQPGSAASSSMSYQTKNNPNTTTLLLTNGNNVVGGQNNLSQVSGRNTVMANLNSNTVLDCSEMTQIIKKFVQEAILEFEDEDMAFCRSIAGALKRIEKSKRETAKLDLQKIIVRYIDPENSGSPSSPSCFNWSSSSCYSSTNNNQSETPGENILNNVSGETMVNTSQVIQNFNNYVSNTESTATEQSSPSSNNINQTRATSNAVSTIITYETANLSSSSTNKSDYVMSRIDSLPSNNIIVSNKKIKRQDSETETKTVDKYDIDQNQEKNSSKNDSSKQ
ncbi:hypothetical protein SSS_07818 [Sarcoptes scabiei]|uniref:MADF domain-containing protein n=1 Tax=Sarcoptes scabiei TaxID=52283 RepID=A0A834RHH1_SARSC|nr:hypothetical protein SSS_07818 [Sarcoptes scabiei]